MTWLAPSRGKRSTMLKKNPILPSGAVFFEVPEDGVATGLGNIVMGDGINHYADLPYFLGYGEPTPPPPYRVAIVSASDTNGYFSFTEDGGDTFIVPSGSYSGMRKVVYYNNAFYGNAGNSIYKFEIIDGVITTSTITTTKTFNNYVHGFCDGYFLNFSGTGTTTPKIECTIANIETGNVTTKTFIDSCITKTTQYFYPGAGISSTWFGNNFVKKSDGTYCFYFYSNDTNNCKIYKTIFTINENDEMDGSVYYVDTLDGATLATVSPFLYCDSNNAFCIVKKTGSTDFYLVNLERSKFSDETDSPYLVSEYSVTSSSSDISPIKHSNSFVIRDKTGYKLFNYNTSNSSYGMKYLVRPFSSSANWALETTSIYRPMIQATHINYDGEYYWYFNGSTRFLCKFSSLDSEDIEVKKFSYGGSSSYVKIAVNSADSLYGNY